jgi:hypothetical protein
MAINQALTIANVVNRAADDVTQSWGVDSSAKQLARNAANTAFQDSQNSPSAVFARVYDAATHAERNGMFLAWKRQYIRRSKLVNPAQSDFHRRFQQYLSRGRRVAFVGTKRSARDAIGVVVGNADKLIQYLLRKTRDTLLPEWLWIVVYVKQVKLIPQSTLLAAVPQAATDLLPMVYIGHRRDSQDIRDKTVVSDARRRTGSTNGLNHLVRLLLDAGLKWKTDFVFDEIWSTEVLGRVDHGHGLEASNAVDASVVEDLKRLEYIQDFINGTGPRPLNAKIDNSLLGATNISGLLKTHDTLPSSLDSERILAKLKKAKSMLDGKRNAYLRLFIKNSNGAPVLPRVGATKDGIGQVRTAQFSQNMRKTLIGQINATAAA